jgi:tRNA U34 5-methylaminomethyl-2-thiouridine-forming methyltransferase MnmC
MSENKSKTISPAPILEWLDNDIPYSAEFSDSYYSKAGGRQETRHVFLNGNNLPERWQDKSEFTIAELGFGTGLNFLETLFQWRKSANQGCRLHYIAFELYPLSSVQMSRALTPWPELSSLAKPLLSKWQNGNEVQHFEFPDKTELTIYCADANIALPRMKAIADAWYLDGFAPARNPQLWSAELMKSVFEHSRPGGTFATYTAAGWVRRNLRAAGFVVERVPGFSGKREMMCGYRPNSL